MAFQFSEKHMGEFQMQGFTIFRGILPPALISDLRRASARGCELVRKARGPQIQRFQPISKFEIERGPFEEYRNLPELRDALARVLSPRHRHGDPDILGVLVEPAEKAWCTNWHRDWIDHLPPGVLDVHPTNFQDPGLFDQTNCALYEDGSTWLVPGSHLRRTALPGEMDAFNGRPTVAPNFEGMTDAAREQACVEYCRRMPGAVQVHLNAGDLALYRCVMWHIGSYAPYRKRATLHDIPDTPEYAAWRKRIEVIQKEQRPAMVKA